MVDLWHPKRHTEAIGIVVDPTHERFGSLGRIATQYGDRDSEIRLRFEDDCEQTFSMNIPTDTVMISQVWTMVDRSAAQIVAANLPAVRQELHRFQSEGNTAGHINFLVTLHSTLLS
jgi:hypothetical protein